MEKDSSEKFEDKRGLGKGNIMVNFVKVKKLKLLTVLIFILASCVIALAENSGESIVTKKILSTVGQRMQKKISVDFRNTPIEDVLRIIADQADIDIIKSPSVVGSVTATLTDVPLEEVLDNILASHGYTYVEGKNMIRIAPTEEIVEVTEKLVSRIYRIHYADVGEVEKALKKFISQRGSLSSNPGTSNIIVTDSESKIQAIDTFIGEIDRVTPQILVEARIYDITTKDRLDLGIEWQAGRNTTFGASGIGTVGTNPTSDRDPFLTGAFSGATGKTSGTSGVLRLGWLNAGIDIDMVLKAQQQNICAKLLANPRILVLDNETAHIKIVSEIPYQEITETSAGGSIGSTDFREIGVELVVTPHVTRDKMIRLRLQPKFSVRAEDVTVGISSNTFLQPAVDRREADTTLLVKSGQTVVLGGLRKKEIAQQMNKIPLLGDLPLIGGLFRFEGEETIISELVVFVTPRIIEDPTLSEREFRNLEATEICEPDCGPNRFGKCVRKIELDHKVQ
ncbi:MAG: secretin and TonB N-terminal domain-containing protein [Planctomycetes bacterium]|nr:secretin and TonB N-terminal domain-containing protein [Planctomycetota bacterium]